MTFSKARCMTVIFFGILIKNRQIIMKTLASILLLAVLFIGCNNNKKQEPPIDKNAVDVEELCFRNEYPFPDSTANIDVLKLDLQISGHTVKGNYNWLPALRDQRNGTLEGSIENRTIKATYRYTQEGVEATAPITIVLKDDRAIVTGDNPGSGLDTEVARISCDSQ